MKKFIIVSSLIAAFLFPYLSVNAAISIDVINTEKTSYFSTHIKEVNKIEDTEIFVFDAETVNIKSEQIDSWEIRFWCDDGIEIYFNNFVGTNSCVDSPNIEIGQTPNKFTMFLKKNVDERIKFSYKLKAFDKDGFWLHSERKYVSW